MEWFGPSNHLFRFEMFSPSHFVMLSIFIFISIIIFLFRKKWSERNWRKIEIGLAYFLILFEMTYHLWMYSNDLWLISRSLPLEICNIGLILAILLLLTKKKIFFELLFFIAILGATQAIESPALTYDFPHFRFFHFFFSHMLIVWIALFFTWVKGYRPTLRSVFKLVFFLNLLLPLILYINKQANGNYWFLRHKPEGPSLYDILGPYPWYIFSVEGLLIILSTITWLVFRKWDNKHNKKSKSHYL